MYLVYTATRRLPLESYMSSRLLVTSTFAWLYIWHVSESGQVDNNNNDGNKIKYFLNVASQIEILFQLTIPNVDLSTNYEI